MATYDSKVSAYIAESADFARPILEYWRNLVHTHCPDVAEAIKWSIPHFDYKGDFMFVMTAYAKHCSFTFLKAPLMSDERLKKSKELKPVQRFMGKITGMEDLPPEEEFVTLLQEAIALNEQGIKLPAAPPDKPKVPDTPDYFLERLAASPEAKAVFDSKSNSFRKEYIVWITDAKTDATRQKRMEEAIGWITEGKSRFWKSKK